MAAHGLWPPNKNINSQLVALFIIIVANSCMLFCEHCCDVHVFVFLCCRTARMTKWHTGPTGSSTSRAPGWSIVLWLANSLYMWWVTSRLFSNIEYGKLSSHNLAKVVTLHYGCIFCQQEPPHEANVSKMVV